MAAPKGNFRGQKVHMGVWDDTLKKWVGWDGEVDVTQGGISGASTDGSVTLTPVNTWVQVPDVVPTSDYWLVISKETETGTIRWSFSNDGVPSTTNGNKMSSDDIIVEMAGDEVLYLGSTVDTDVVNWTAKID